MDSSALDVALICIILSTMIQIPEECSNTPTTPAEMTHHRQLSSAEFSSTLRNGRLLRQVLAVGVRLARESRCPHDRQPRSHQGDPSPTGRQIRFTHTDVGHRPSDLRLQRCCLSPFGPQLKRMRRICVELFLTTTRLESFPKQRAQEAQHLLRAVWEHVEEGESDLRQVLGAFSMTKVTRMLVGKQYFGVESSVPEDAMEFMHISTSHKSCFGCWASCTWVITCPWGGGWTLADARRR